MYEKLTIYARILYDFSPQNAQILHNNCPKMEFFAPPPISYACVQKFGLGMGMASALCNPIMGVWGQRGAKPLEAERHSLFGAQRRAKFDQLSIISQYRSFEISPTEQVFLPHGYFDLNGQPHT